MARARADGPQGPRGGSALANVSGELGRRRPVMLGGGPLCALAGAMLLRVLPYNPMHATTADRMHELSAGCDQDVLALPGTTRVAERDSALPVVVGPAVNHDFYHWGYRRGKMVNKSAGMAIAVHKRWSMSVRKTWVPPARFQGRLAALRLRDGRGDYTIVAVYLRSTMSARDMQECIVGRLAWVSGLLESLPRRTTPILVGDFNDEFQWDPLRDGDGADRVVGPHAHGQEHATARRLRELLQVHYMSVITSEHQTGATYYGPSGRTSAIYHVCALTSAKALVVRCRARLDYMRFLQVVATVEMRDHVPVEVVFAAPCHVPRRADPVLQDRPRRFDAHGADGRGQTGVGRGGRGPPAGDLG